MTVQYVLHKSYLVGAPEGYVARVRPQGSASLDNIIERILERDTTVGRVDIVGVLEAYHDAIERFVQEGKNVVTPLAIFGASIRGMFDSPADAFDPSRHQVIPRARAAQRLRRALRDVLVERIRREAPRPRLELYIDIASGEQNGTVTPGSPGRLLGSKLSFEATDPEQGVFFRAADGSVVRVEFMVKSMPGELIFNAPALSPGDYRLEVRASFNNNGDPRVGVLAETLSVNG